MPKISAASTQLDLNLFTTSSSASVRTGGVPPPGNRPPSPLIRVERIAAQSGLREFFGSADRNFQYRKRKFIGPLWSGSVIQRHLVLVGQTLRLRAALSRALRILLNCRGAGAGRPAQAEGLPHKILFESGKLSGIGSLISGGSQATVRENRQSLKTRIAYL